MIQKISPALRLTILYLFFSGTWILLSDAILIRIAGNNIELLNRMQSIKGIFFITLCSILLFFISRGFYKNISNSLRQTQELLYRYKALGEASKEGIVDHDLLTDRAVINEQMKFYLGEESNLIEHYSFKHKNRIHQEDRQWISKNFNDTVARGSNIWQADYRYKLYDGSFHDITIRGSIIRNEEGKPVRFISALQDVSEVRNMRTLFYEQQIRHKQLLGQSIIKAQENERNRWAEELHDNVGQLLTVVKLYLDQLAMEKSFSPQLLAKSQEMTVKALNDIRQLSAAIKPPEFSISTLRQSIEVLIANIARIRSYQFEIDFESSDEKKFSNEQKLMIYRVVQEQLNNIIKYAEATNISIRIKTCEHNVIIQVIDNGKGFDTSQVVSGIGLRNIRSRLQVYAGNLNIESSPGQGCKLIADFSLS